MRQRPSSRRAEHPGGCIPSGLRTCTRRMPACPSAPRSEDSPYVRRCRHQRSACARRADWRHSDAWGSCSMLRSAPSGPGRKTGRARVPSAGQLAPGARASCPACREGRAGLLPGSDPAGPAASAEKRPSARATGHHRSCNAGTVHAVAGASRSKTAATTGSGSTARRIRSHGRTVSRSHGHAVMRSCGHAVSSSSPATPWPVRDAARHGRGSSSDGTGCRHASRAGSAFRPVRPALRCDP